jgi:hypothetical protein
VTGWGLIWALWVGTLAVSFTYLEARAIHDPKTGDTLSENVRAWFHTRERTGAGRLGRVLFLLLMAGFPVWFSVHILVPGFV